MKDRSNQLDCCGRKSSVSAFKIILLVALGALLVVAVMESRAHAQDAAPASNSADAAPAAPPVEGRVERLSYIEGQVTVCTEPGSQPEPAVANMPLVQGSMVQTGQDGRAEIQFEDGSVIRIVPNSRLQIASLAGDAAGSLDSDVDLLAGEGYFELNPTSGDGFVVHALGLEITAVEPADFRISWTSQPEQVAVSYGYVRVRHASDYVVQTNANETLSIDDQDVTRYLLSTGTDSDMNDAWNEQRDQYLDDAESRATSAQSTGDTAGAADLDAYGTYYDVPGYGSVWQPYGYDASWSPYDDGYWAWYPWGYTWISAYPWGWAPYHCGYWNYFGGFGWGWAGGGCGIGIWYPIGVWHGGPIGWRPPRRPIWRPTRPVHRLQPVGATKDHPYQPAPAHRVPAGFTPHPVTINGRAAHPLAPVPPGERPHNLPASHAAAASAVDRGSDVVRATGQPYYGSRQGNPELGHGGPPASSRPAPVYHAPPSAPRFSAPSGGHSSPPPASHSGGGGHR